MKVKDIIRVFEQFAPFSYQEPYDNSGLQLGDPEREIESALLCIDITEEVLDEAIEKKADLIISHHPLLFKGIKSLTGSNYTERILIKAIRKNIAILSVHTNIDIVNKGVSSKMCEKIGLKNCKVLDPVKNKLEKLVFFVPESHADKVREKIFEAGAGVIGNYDMCSYNIKGEGSFRALENTQPFVGEKGKLHIEPEIRIETILPEELSAKVVAALLSAHPYEEVAYDLYPLKNKNYMIGLGMTGELEKDMDETEFLKLLKEKFTAKGIRYTSLLGKKIRKVAVCGGSGSSLLSKAIASGADAFVSADFKYHQFFDAENSILIADIGHYESEQFTKELFYELLTKNYPKFALHLSEVNTNPINYL
ncbi:MAG: Nif3-like dinuclear metal center hexameric protein [Bacteroidales bacterium]|nr:Nif3-like dinuclear metal center hexameric protein [Bacteroidales bacterium]MCB8999766.1 Nif3-like dinuclear metal center hexameric protein [Bacteroidales bacterium]MCB9013423.1 Nif3-like dinuclear metal center hexameric protein [Bacteroidales bacterium]